MDIGTLTTFFMWCTIINGGLLVFSSIMCMLLKNWMFGMHSKMFGISRDAFNVSIYAFLGVFKIVWFVFNVVPYVALLIIR